MEKRTCKLCFKTFSNGRALGGHMRSHMLKLQANPSPPPPLPPPQAASHLFRQLEYQTDSASYGYSSEEEEEEKGLSYGLRENPRKSFRLVDPEFASFAVDAGSVVQDRESETESSRNPSRRRSKRSRKTGLMELPTHLQNQEYWMRKKPNSIRAELAIEQEPVSSVSDTTPEEDVALCLMMLSRGITISRKGKEVEEEDYYDDEQDEEEEEKLMEESEDELEETKIRVKRSRGKFQCDTCKKFFRSYQALGGHRASHKKNKGCITYDHHHHHHHQGGGNVVSATPPPTAADPRVHECPVCLRVFSSGQALGGHKRSHLTGASSSAQQQPIRTSIANPTTTRLGNNLKLIDLNLPAPMDDEDQIELSAVSDGEFNKFS